MEVCRIDRGEYALKLGCSEVGELDPQMTRIHTDIWTAHCCKFKFW